MRSAAGGARSVMVAEALRTAIYSGDLKPGDPVREMGLAKDLKVSQTTIREALLQLEHAGLVVRTMKRGTKVTQLSEREIAERVGLRITLEGWAAAEAAKRARPDDVRELVAGLEEITAAVNRNAYYEAAHADLEFHRCLWRMAGNEVLYKILDELTAPLFAFVSIVKSRDSEDLHKRVHRHEPILAAVTSGKAAAARKAIREHIKGSYY